MTHSVECYVYRFLIHKNITSLPISYNQLLEYCKAEGYQVAFYAQERSQKIMQLYNLQQYSETKNAFTISKPDIKIILISNTLSLGERCVALAHELGHIVLQHTNQEILGKSADNQELENAQEEEADSFALCLLAPLCVLRKYNILAASKVEQTSGLPKMWAREAVIAAMERNDSYSPLENALLDDLSSLDRRKKEEPAPPKADSDSLNKESPPTFWEEHWYILVGIGITLIVSGIAFGVWFFFFQ